MMLLLSAGTHARQDGLCHPHEPEDIDGEDTLRLGDGDLICAPLSPRPALLTSMSMRPNRSMRRSTTALTDSSLATSRYVMPARGVTREMSRLAPIIRDQAPASAAAAQFPTPKDAPVTSTTGRVPFIVDSLTR